MIIPRGARVVSNRQTSTGQISTQAMSNAVSTVDNIATVVDTIMDQRAESNALEAKNKLAAKRNEIINKAKQTQGKDAQGMTPNYMKELSDYESEITKEYGKRTLSKVTPYSSNLKNDTEMSLINYESQQEQESKKATFNTGVTLAFDTVKADAKDWERAKFHMEDSFDSAVKSGIFMPEEIEAKRAELSQKFRGEVGNNYYTQDRHDFVKNIDRFGFGKPEKQAWLDKYKKDNMAEERERKSLYNDEKSRILAMKDDMRAQSLANSNSSYYFDNATKLENMGFKNEARELREEGQLYSKVIDFNQDHKNKSLAEIQAEAMALNVAPELEGSNKDYRANLMIQKEITNQVKLFKNDPAAFVSLKAVGASPEEVADSRLRLQKEQGITGVAPRVLTLDEKKNFKNLWDTGDVTSRTEIINKAMGYGRHSGRVLGELGINSTLQLAPLISNERDQKMLIAGVQNKSFKDFTDEGKNEYVSQAKGSEFYQMVAGIQKDFSFTSVANEKLQEVEKVMLGISSNNLDPAAGPKFFKDNFNIVNEADMKVFVPKSMDSGDVEDMLSKRKEEFLNQRLQSVTSVTDKIKVKSNIQNAVWINSSNGVVLVDKVTGQAFQSTEFDLFGEDPVYKDLASKRKSAVNKVTQR